MFCYGIGRVLAIKLIWQFRNSEKTRFSHIFRGTIFFDTDMKQLPLLIAVPLLFMACTKNAPNTFAGGSYRIANDYIAPCEAEMIPEAANFRPSLKYGMTANASQASEQKIIKEGSMEIEVSQLDTAKTQVDNLLKKSNGYYSHENYRKYEFSTEYSLGIRIPADSLEIFVSKIEGLGYNVTSKDIHARDVTEHYIDLETRLNNKKNYLAQYNELLKKAKTITEISDIEDKIRVIEEEVESTTNQLEYLQGQIDYSSLEMSITKRTRYYDADGNLINKDSVWKRIADSVKTSIHIFVEFIYFLIKIWPFIAIAAIVYARIHKRRKRDKK